MPTEELNRMLKSALKKRDRAIVALFGLVSICLTGLI